MRRRNRALLLPSLAAAIAWAPHGGAAGPAAASGATLAQRFHPPPPKEGYSYPECYCTDSKGRRVEIGERACLTVGERRYTALCDMSLNNPVWREESEGCPVS